MTLTTDGTLNVDISGSAIVVSISGQSVNFVQSLGNGNLTQGEFSVSNSSGGTQMPNVPCGQYFIYRQVGTTGATWFGTLSSPPYFDGGGVPHGFASALDKELAIKTGNVNKFRVVTDGSCTIGYLGLD
jgi:hypothetical protein